MEAEEVTAQRVGLSADDSTKIMSERGERLPDSFWREAKRAGADGLQTATVQVRTRPVACGNACWIGRLATMYPTYVPRSVDCAEVGLSAWE